MNVGASSYWIYNGITEHGNTGPYPRLTCCPQLACHMSPTACFYYFYYFYYFYWSVCTNHRKPLMQMRLCVCTKHSNAINTSYQVSLNRHASFEFEILLLSPYRLLG